ncbi:MAG: tRNA pseudouridine(55) synthase TruB [Bacteroidales bacterium]|nr:tRNA pseudouridine(55) synthase TruB [Bacteroidales bacterium]
MTIEEFHISPEELNEGIVIPVDKPRGWSSFQVVNKLKWLIKRELNIKKFKIGHAGTLDPLATGLLLVCAGPATKQIPSLQEGEKEYSGTMVLGATTPCFDLERAIDAYYPTAQINEDLIEAVRQRFVGKQHQVPPMFSAVKVEGQRAYEAARNGEEQDLRAKEVAIHEFGIISFRAGKPVWKSASLGAAGYMPDKAVMPYARHAEEGSPHKEYYRNPQGYVPDFLPQIDFQVRCSKGTYIRSLARDFGAALGSGAYLSALRRTRIGEHFVSDAMSL